ncbi:MAG TPA: ABC transporter permease [Kofleriaceae bacterium]|nr:ABC transporter permease [Kofleriaceae bacterium]
MTLPRLLRWELFKLYRRPASYVGFVLCLAFCVVVLIGFAVQDYKGRHVAGIAMDPSDYLNGPFFASFILQVGFFAVLPLVAATVAGSQLAAEAKDGTLRAMLVRPPSRTAVYLAKALATLVWLQLVVWFLLALALLLGHVAYGGGSLLVFVWEFRKDGMWIVPPSTWVPMFVLASIGLTLALALVASLALCISAMTDNPVVAHVGTLGGFFISSILQRLPDQILGDDFKQLLPTTHMNFWHEVFRWYHPYGHRVAWAQLARDLGWSFGLTALFLVVGLVAFRRRDLTS